MDKILSVDELIKELEEYTHKELHIHHTWKPDHTDWDKRPDPFYWQGSMRNYHVNTNGWQDIGQHVTLLPDGRFVTGRDFSVTPASITSYNAGAFAVEMLGNFDTGNDTFTGAQKQAMLALARWFDGKGRYIRFHRENSPKTCPGSSIDKEKFMYEVRAYKDAELISPWAVKAVMKLKEAKIMIGDDRGYFNPQRPATREELAVVIARLLERGIL